MTYSDDEKRRATAHHEAGHAVLTIVSRFFQLTDPALKLAPTIDATVQSGTRTRVKRDTDEAMALEHVEIALAGRAAEILFEEITEAEGRRIVMHADSCGFDFDYARNALAYWKAESRREELLASALATLRDCRHEWEELAAYVQPRLGVVAELSKDEVEALPAVRRLMEKKRAL